MTDKTDAELLESVLQEYVSNLEAYLCAQRERRFKAGNKYVDKAYIAAKRLRLDFGRKGREAIVELLKHPDTGIRTCAASDCIDFAEDVAVNVLEDIAASDSSFDGMAAQYCLKEWRAGRKKFPGGPIELESGEYYGTD